MEKFAIHLHQLVLDGSGLLVSEVELVAMKVSPFLTAQGATLELSLRTRTEMVDFSQRRRVCINSCHALTHLTMVL